MYVSSRRQLNDPSVDGGVIHGDPTFPHEFFHVTRTQRIRHVPADARENNLVGEMGPFEAHRHGRSPSLGTLDRRGRSYLKSPQRKIATEPSCKGWLAWLFSCGEYATPCRACIG